MHRGRLRLQFGDGALKVGVGAHEFGIASFELRERFFGFAARIDVALFDGGDDAIYARVQRGLLRVDAFQCIGEARKGGGEVIHVGFVHLSS